MCMAGKNEIIGNGEIILKNLEVSQFNEFYNQTKINIIVTNNEDDFITLEVDENLIEYIVVTSKRKTLRISIKDDFIISPSKANIYISAKQIRYFNLKGPGGILIENISLDKVIEISNKGTGNVELNNCKYDKINISNLGTGNVSIEDYKTRELRLENLGTGHILLRNCNMEAIEIKCIKTIIIEDPICK